MSDVQAGDVLLFRGRGFVSKGIRFLDGSEVNHAAIALDATTLSEATGHGLDTSPITAAIERNERTWQLRPTGGDPESAARRATEYEANGVPYAYQQILLLAALCLSRRVPIGNRVFRKMVRRALDSAADLLNSMIDKGADLMICSEYVYRCHQEIGFDLLPGGVPDLAGVGPAEGIVLLKWLEEQPARPGALNAAYTPVGAEPMTVAEIATFELDGLLAEFFADIDPAVPVTLRAVDEPEVTDAELAAAADHFGAAALRLAGVRNAGQPAALGLGPADAVTLLKGMLSTNANFVTPRDLFFTSRLKRLGELP